MSRRLDPENVTDADRRYFEQFENGRLALETQVSEDEAERQRQAYLKAVEDARATQRRVSEEEAKKAEDVLDSPASTGSEDPQKRAFAGDTVQNVTPPAPDPNDNVTVNPADLAATSASEPVTGAPSKRTGEDPSSQASKDAQPKAAGKA